MTHRLPAFACSVILLLTTPGTAEPPPRPQHDDTSHARAQLLSAYQGTATYHSTVRHERTESDGRWTRTETGDFHIAFDRAAKRLRIDHPDLLLICDGATLWMKLRHLPNRYLQQDAPEQLDYQSILRVAPILDDPIIPELALLLGNDTINGLLDWPASIEQGADTTIYFTKPRQSFTLQLHPDTHLIASAAFDVDLGPPPSTVSLNYRTTIHTHNEPLDDALFEFDTRGATPYDSIRDMIRARPLAHQQGGAGRTPTHPQIGQDAPTLSLKNLDGETVQIDPAQTDDVIVLEFWATWCGPCRGALPKLQQFHQWATENNQPVRLVAVDLMESAEQIREYLNKAELSLPVLIDPDGAAAAEYGVQPIPHTVIIHKGKIRHVHLGFNPEIDKVLIAEVQALLNEPQPER